MVKEKGFGYHLLFRPCVITGFSLVLGRTLGRPVRHYARRYLKRGGSLPRVLLRLGFGLFRSLTKPRTHLGSEYVRAITALRKCESLPLTNRSLIRIRFLKSRVVNPKITKHLSRNLKCRSRDTGPNHLNNLLQQA